MTVSLRNTPLLVESAATATPSAASSWNSTTPVLKDLLLAVVTIFGSTTATLGTTPTGWTLSSVDITESARCTVAYYTRTATGTSGDNAPTWTGTTTGTALDSDFSVTLYDFYDSSGSTPVLGLPGTATGTTTSPIAPVTSNTVPAAGCFGVGGMCYGASTSTDTSITTPTGWTKGGETTTTVSHFGHGGTYYISSPTAGSTLTCSMTHGTSTFVAGAVALIIPPTVPYIVQSMTVVGYSGSFTNNVQAGSTIMMFVDGYNPTNPMSSSAPTFNGSTPTGSVMAFGEQAGGSDGGNDYGAIWMMPNVAGGAKTVAVTSGNLGTNSVCGLACYEVANLGATPAIDQVTSQNSTSATSISITTGATIYAAEFVMAMLVQDQTLNPGPGGSGWANHLEIAGATNSQTWAQIQTTAGGTYTVANTETGGTNWIVGIVTIYASTPPVASIVAVNQAVMRAAIW